jgi:hypothetical protein
MVQAGIECKNKAHYKTFGKFIINCDLLVNDYILLVKYSGSYAPVPSLKRTTIGDALQKAILELLDSSKINYDLLKDCNHHDRQVFERLITRAGLHKQLDYDKNLCKMNENGLKLRFEILRGEILADNNNQEIVDELIYIINELMEIKVISASDGKDLLEELK